MQIPLIDTFKSVKDLQLSSEQQSRVQRREANNRPNNYHCQLSVHFSLHQPATV